MAKQLLPLNSQKSMIQETVERLLPLAKAKRFWVITNDDLRAPIVRQLKKLNKQQIIAEPAGRNTAPAIGLAAFLLEKRDPSAVIGMFPSDHVIGDEKRFRDDIRRAAEIAAKGANIVVIGIKPTRGETGYGYIEAGSETQKGVLQVRRFTEKPTAKVAEQFEGWAPQLATLVTESDTIPSCAPSMHCRSAIAGSERPALPSLGMRPI